MKRSPSPGPVLRALGLLLPIALVAFRTLAAPKQLDSPDLRMETLAHIGGPSLAVAAMGERVLLGEGEHVLVVDVSRTSAPMVIGRSEWTSRHRPRRAYGASSTAWGRSAPCGRMACGYTCAVTATR
ncbi:MAG: hypothetical protein IT332_14145 [Ardenticatenales bacterium]|nr:hypothetical protein [Ardenticatenales bacterium]